MNVLQSVAAGATKTKDEYDICGEYVVSKLRNLSDVLTEQAMEMVKFNYKYFIASEKSKPSINNKFSGA